jgi:hypothetical protein
MVLEPTICPTRGLPEMIPEAVTVVPENALEPIIGPTCVPMMEPEAVTVVAETVFEPTIGPTTDVVPAMFVLEMVAGRSPF